MPDGPAPRSLERGAGLVRAALYERTVGASLERVWENVHDWEHLPWLHHQAFRAIDLEASGDWGWAARVGFPDGSEARIELVVDAAANRYVARTLEGAGAPAEIWTSLAPGELPAEATRVRVEFWLAERPEDALRALGQGYATLYRGLWDQDEAMMQQRAQSLARRAPPAAGAGRGGEEPVVLGSAAALRRNGPSLFEFGGRSFRLLEVDGQWVAHSTECPHWGGPLGGCAVEQGQIVCPWHGYRFDVRQGTSADGRGLRLRPAPRIAVDEVTGVVRALDARNVV